MAAPTNTTIRQVAHLVWKQLPEYLGDYSDYAMFIGSQKGRFFAGQTTLARYPWTGIPDVIGSLNKLNYLRIGKTQFTLPLDVGSRAVTVKIRHPEPDIIGMKINITTPASAGGENITIISNPLVAIEQSLTANLTITSPCLALLTVEKTHNYYQKYAELGDITF